MRRRNARLIVFQRLAESFKSHLLHRRLRSLRTVSNGGYICRRLAAESKGTVLEIYPSGETVILPHRLKREQTLCDRLTPPETATFLNKSRRGNRRSWAHRPRQSAHHKA